MATLRPGSSLAHLALYLLAVDLGRVAGAHADGVIFFWPAAGLAALWMLDAQSRRELLVNSSLLVACNVVLLVTAFDIPPAAAVLFGLGNLTVGLTVRWFSARAEGASYWSRLPRRLARPRDLTDVGVASIAAAVTSAVFGVTAIAVGGGDPSWVTVVAWVVRNASSTFIVLASVLG